MRTLMVTPYAPMRDGIAAYAVQAVASLRRSGTQVEVLSPGPSAAHHHLDLSSPRGALALAKRVGRYDKVVVQFHPDVFYRVPAQPAQLLASHLALAVAFRAARELEVWLHEIDYRWAEGGSPGARAVRALWRIPDRIMVHTDVERDDFLRAFRVPPEKVHVARHGADFVPRTAHDRASARSSLGIPPDAFSLLSLGFIQPHKGFDRAIRAFAASGLADRGARLDVVGSVRLDDPALAAHVDELEQLTDSTPGVHLHQGYLSDELFDRWLVASDLVVLPYRHIWSSGVLERALLYRRPVLATAVGGLAQQAEDAGELVTLVPAEEPVVPTLAMAMRRRAGGDEPPPRASESWPDERDAVQAEVVDRAAMRRGGGLLPRPVPAAGSTAAVRPVAGAAGLSAPLRRLPPLAVPSTASTRFSARFVKGVVRRLTAWQADPVVWQVNALREATIAALDRAEGRNQQRDQPA